MKKKTTGKLSLSLCLLFAAPLMACGGGNEHEPKAKWSYDEVNHWHDCIKEGHDDKLDVEAHTFSSWVHETPADYGVTGLDKAACDTCDYVKTRTVAALDAKENAVSAKESASLSKEYDGQAIGLEANDFDYNGDGALTISYKEKDGEGEYSSSAPKAVGEYTVKVEVAATAEWKGCEVLLNYEIKKKVLRVSFNISYNASSVFNWTPDGVVSGERVTATITMTSKDVGATPKAVSLTGKDAGNYSLALEDVRVGIFAVSLNVSKFNFMAKSAAEMRFALNSTEHGIKSGDEVYAEIENASSLTEGTYSLYAASQGTASKAAKVVLSGKDAKNYALSDASGLGQLVYATNWSSQITDVSTNTDTYGHFEFDALQTTKNTLTIPGQSQGGFAAEAFSTAAYKDKQFNVEVRVGDASGALIVKYSRSGVKKGALNYVEEGGFVDFDKYLEMTFDLIKGVEGYTDENGYWCHYGDVALYVKVEASDIETMDFEGTLSGGFAVSTPRLIAFENGPMDEGKYKLVLENMNGQIALYDSFGAAIPMTGRSFALQSETGYIAITPTEAEEDASISFGTIDDATNLTPTTLTFLEGQASSTDTYQVGTPKFFKAVLPKPSLPAFMKIYTFSLDQQGYEITLYGEDGAVYSGNSITVKKSTVVYVEVNCLETASSATATLNIQ